MSELTGILLINIGSPDSTAVSDVRTYLREFLSDPRVVDIHPLARWCLLNLIILPTRPKKSAAAYAQIWQPEGSPLVLNTQAQQVGLANALGQDFVVEIGMRYGSPSIAQGLERLQAQGCHRIVVLPLFPQYSSAANGSAAEEVMRHVQNSWNLPPIEILGDFFDHPLFIDALAQHIRPQLSDFNPDLLLFSYHGLPERHVEKSDHPDIHCDRQGPCPAVGKHNRFCYRAQCYQTSRLLGEALQLTEQDYAVSFQSRLGRTPWIKPYTDVLLEEIAAQGVKRLAVTSPSFAADCLETLEEIQIRLQEQWHEAGGEAFLFIPCLNDHPRFVETMAALVTDSATPAVPEGTTSPVRALG